MECSCNRVKWSHWGEQGLLEYGEMPRKNMQANLQQFELEARKLLKETGAAHVVYGRKMFDQTGKLKEIRFYLKPMSEEEFEEAARIPQQQVYAVHKEGVIMTKDTMIGYKMFRTAEYNFLESFVSENSFEDEVCRDQLRMLWTAYCLHHNLDVDTSGYDSDLLNLWRVLSESGDGTSEWENYDQFDNFMCKYLV